jgi:hypothetical protein
MHDGVITCYPSTRNIFYQQLPVILIASEDVESQWFFPVPIKTNHQSKKQITRQELLDCCHVGRLLRPLMYGSTSHITNCTSFHPPFPPQNKQKLYYKCMKYQHNFQQTQQRLNEYGNIL